MAKDLLAMIPGSVSKSDEASGRNDDVTIKYRFHNFKPTPTVYNRVTRQFSVASIGPWVTLDLESVISAFEMPQLSFRVYK